MTVIVNNLAINYTDEGHGPVVLLLHGWGDSSDSFTPLTHQLVGWGYRVVRVDLPGFGGSQLPLAAWGVGDYAMFVADFLAKLRLKAAVMIGHSLGGRILLKGVGEGTLHADKLVLLASAGLYKGNSARNLAYRVVAKVGKVATALPPMRPLRISLRQKLYRRAGSDYASSGNLQATFLRVVNEDLSGPASHIHVPALLVWGSADDQTPVSDGHRLHELITGSSLKVVAGAGHFVHLDQPAATAGFIREFLAS